MSNVHNNTSNEDRILSMDEVEDAILSRWEDAGEDQPSENEAEANQEATEETQGELDFEEAEEVEIEPDDESDPEEEVEAEDEEVEEQEEIIELDDETLIDVQIDGETKQASVKELKRLYGQEQSLTRKSQEAASKRKDADDAINKTSVIMQKMLEQAEARYKPYEDVDMLVASKTMDTEDFAQLRKEASEAQKDLQFLREEADTFYKGLQEQQQAMMQDAAKQCVEVLQKDIPEWNNELYNDIRGYAIAQGLPEDQVNQYVDPNVIKLINKARLYDQGKRVATVKKKAASTKKVLRTKKAPANDTTRRNIESQKRREALRKSGGNDLDDIADALLGRWQS